MSVTAHTITEWEIRIPDKVTDGTGTEKTVWIVPVPFSATRYVNDVRHLGEDTNPLEQRIS